MRIDKLLAHTGYGSRKDVKKFLKEHVVTKNGERVTKGQTQIDESKDLITVDDTVISYTKYVYYMLNKPQGYLSATTDDTQPTVIDLIDDPHELFPIGRLDKDTEGLMIITNDGQLSHRLTSPKSLCPKVYYVEVDGPLDASVKALFAEGIMLDEKKTLPAQLEIEETTNTHARALITIYEGRYHQVKRMFAAAGVNVTYLKRLSIGSLTLDSTLTSGAYRPLSQDEIDSLKEEYML